jgi:RNA polymerase sigma-B factor
MRRLETEKLWELRREGDAAAREELVRRHLPLARQLASRYRRRSEPFDDLVQVASVGLLHAVDRYDPDRGTPFHAFAVPTILGELKRYFRDTGWSVRVPRGTQDLALRCERVSRQMADQLARPPRVSELAECMGVGVEEVIEGLEAMSAHFSVSLDAPAKDASPQTPALGELVGADDERYALVDARLALIAGIRRLPYLERRAVMLRMSDNLKQTEIASRLGCSQMQVSRLLSRAATRLERLA